MSAPVRRDASMSLLTEVMQNPLDPGYAAAARERASAPPEGSRPLPSVAVTTVVAVVLGALSTAAILDLRLPGAADARDLLLSEIEQRTQEADAVAVRVDALRDEVGALQEDALAEDGAPVLVLRQRLSVEAGALPVVGPGIVLTLDDAPRPPDALGGEPSEADGEVERVVDYDLQIAVNGLWEAGAEAVAVNGQRLTSLSAIRSAGGAVLVGFRPLEPPYRVQAVGDPAGLETGLARSSAGSYLSFVAERYGLRLGVERSDRLELPAAGSLSLRYARVANPSEDASVEDQEMDQ